MGNYRPNPNSEINHPHTMAVAEQSGEKPEARYYVTLDGQVRGPFGLELIEAMVLSGNFPAGVPVCKVGSQEWSPLHVNIQLTQTAAPALTPKKAGLGLGASVAISIFTLLFLMAVAVLSRQSKSGTQQPSAQPAVANTSTATPQLTTPNSTPSTTMTYGGIAGRTYQVPHWANQGLAAKKSALDAQEASLNSLKSQVEALGNQIERERPNLNQTSQYAIDAFNREVDRYNALNQQLKDGIDTFNTGVNDYNAELARVGTPIN